MRHPALRESIANKLFASVSLATFRNRPAVDRKAFALQAPRLDKERGIDGVGVGESVG